jgi:Rrf2 family iron-sulfur cluster assembly transcriptional regulator
MILGTKARYAVMAMVELSACGSERPVTLAQLAESQEIPLPYLEQIFAKLRKAELVKSVRGPGGGYALTKPADATTVAEIITAVDEQLKMTRCATESNGCRSNKTRCATHELWDGLGQHIYDYLNGVTLAEISGKKQGGCTSHALKAMDVPHSAC